MLNKQSVPLIIAVVEDSFSYKDYKGNDNIEYNVTPYTTPEEFTKAIGTLNPDLVILNEHYLNLAKELSCPILMVVDSSHDYINKYRKAISVGIKGIIQKPVDYEKIVTALKGDFLKEQHKDSNVFYIDELCDLKIPKAIKTEKVSPKLDLPTAEEIKKEIKPVILKQSDERAKIITFYNSKGGVGKTLFSINNAIYIARMYPSKKIALVDFDLDFGDVANFLGIEPRITALSWQYIPDDSLEKVDIDNYLIKHPTGIYVLPAPIPPIDEDIFTYKIAHKILSTLRKHFDVVIVDLGPTLRDVVVVTIEHADKIYLVSTTNLSSLRNTYDMVRIFNGLKIDQSKISLILNNVKRNVDQKELKQYIPYKVVLKVPHIKQVELIHDEQNLAMNNKRFKVYLEDLSIDIFGKKPEKKPFWIWRR